MAGRVLIIEDNPINRELLDYLLRAHGLETLNAVNGRVGLDIACRELPDLILCDIQMPGMDGFEFLALAKAHEQLRHIPLLAVTALAMVGDRDRILAKGFDGYVAKPIHPQTFMQTINEFLPASRRLVPQAPRPPSAYVIPAPARPACILVLDDSAMNLELERYLLGPHGYEVLTADTAAQALQIARERVPSLILSDVGMRHGSGFDFIRQVKADPQLRGIPFIFLSSTHWDADSSRLGLELGAARYLKRPMDLAVLLAEIRACLAG